MAPTNMERDTMVDENPKTLINDIGDYLVEAAEAWSQLINALLDSPQIHQAVIAAHEESKNKNDLSDLSTIVSMDVGLSRLRYVSFLASPCTFRRDS